MPANESEVQKMVAGLQNKARFEAEARQRDLSERKQAEEAAKEPARERRIRLIEQNVPSWIDAVLAAGKPEPELFTYKVEQKKFMFSEIVTLESAGWRVARRDTRVEIQPFPQVFAPAASFICLSADGKFFFMPTAEHLSVGRPMERSNLRCMEMADQIVDNLEEMAKTHGVDWQRTELEP